MTKKTKLFHLTLGDQGSWVTLVNGHARTHRDFKVLSAHLVKQGFRVLSMDNRGSGDSLVSEPFTMEDMAQDIVDLWSELEIESSFVLGISMGGMIALKLAKASEVLRGLILVSSTPSLKYYLADSFEWSTHQEGILNQLQKYFHPKFYEANKLLVNAMAKQLLLAQQVDPGQSLMQRAAIRMYEWQESYFKELNMPTLVIHGEDDEIISFEAAKYLNRQISGSHLISYPETGHLILAEKPARFYEDVSNFLKSQSE